VSGEDREHQFLFQRISVAIQRFNAVLLHNGFLLSDHQDAPDSFFIIFFLGNIPTKANKNSKNNKNRFL